MFSSQPKRRRASQIVTNTFNNDHLLSSLMTVQASTIGIPYVTAESMRTYEDVNNDSIEYTELLFIEPVFHETETRKNGKLSQLDVQKFDQESYQNGKYSQLNVLKFDQVEQEKYQNGKFSQLDVQKFDQVDQETKKNRKFIQLNV